MVKVKFEWGGLGWLGFITITLRLRFVTVTCPYVQLFNAFYIFQHKFDLGLRLNTKRIVHVFEFEKYECLSKNDTDPFSKAAGFLEERMNEGEVSLQVLTSVSATRNFPR